MSTVFCRTIRSLESDGPRHRASLLLGTGLLAGWAAWFTLGRVCLYEVSQAARLEASGLVRPVVALTAGQVARNDLVLGERVGAGDLLVQLDDRSEQLELEEGRARLADLEGRLAPLDSEIAAETAAAADHERAGAAAVQELASRVDEASALARLAEDRLHRTQDLIAAQAATPAEHDERRAEKETTEAALQALRAAHRHRAESRKVEAADRRVRLARLERERAELIGELAIRETIVRQLERAIELKKVRAPVSGRIGQVCVKPAGAALESGENLACIVPDGEPRVVASFPASASGRIRPGQRSRLRLDGFPWLEYGSIGATVTDVANEPQGDLLRVELDLCDDQGLCIPVEHGLPGSAEVEVDRVSPAVLVLRRIGALLRRERPSVAPTLQARDGASRQVS